MTNQANTPVIDEQTRQIIEQAERERLKKAERDAISQSESEPQKPKRKYTRRANQNVSDNQTESENAKPKRKYTRKSESAKVPNQNTPTNQKQKRRSESETTDLANQKSETTTSVKSELANQKSETKPKQHRNRPDLKKFGYENAKPGDNARYLRYALASVDLPPIDISDPVQVEHRIQEYFSWCIQNDQKPKVTGMANWLGVTRERISVWYNGGAREATHANIVKKYYGILEELWENYMQDGTINTVSGIFLGKVMFGYRETSEVVVTPNTPLQSIDSERARETVLAALPEETE